MVTSKRSRSLMRVQALVLILPILVGMLSNPAHAFTTPKPNEPCEVAGNFGIANGLMMTCVDSNSTLNWKLNTNVVAGGLCSAWVPGDKQTWAELQLFIKGAWVTQLVPIAFTPGPPCDTSKTNSSIPWAALSAKVAEGTKFRWLFGNSGKDGHGGRAFGKAYPSPAFTYSKKAMSAPYLKVFTAIVDPVEGPHVYAMTHNSTPTS